MAQFVPLISAVGGILSGASALGSLFGGAPKAPSPSKPPAIVQPPPAAAAVTPTAPQGVSAGQRAGAAAYGGTVGSMGSQGLTQPQSGQKATLLG